MSRVKITVLSDASAPSLVLALIPAFAAAIGIPAEDTRRLGAVVEQVVAFTLDNAYPDDDLGEIEVMLEAGDGSVHVAVHDWGLPLTSAGGEYGSLPEPLAALVCAENGKSLADARAEVAYAAEFFRWFAEEAVRTDGSWGPSPAGGVRNVVTARPVGVAALVTPWNFPAAMATLSGSNGSTARGMPVLTLQKAQARVQTSPRIITVACFLVQHSPIFGQAASSHTVLRLRSRISRRVSA